METKPPFNMQDNTPGAWRDDVHLAIVFLTRLPMPSLDHVPDGALARAVRAFPLAGLMVGLAGAMLWVLGHYLALPPLVVAILVVALGVFLTGALHEDGLADVADGFGSGGDREKTLGIMRDSLLGTYGVLALVICVGLKVAMLASFDLWTGAFALVGCAMASRASMAVVLATLSPARHDGLAAKLDRLALPVVIQSLAIGIGSLLLLLHPVQVLCALLLAGAGLYGLIRVSKRKIGGHTGDVCGAAQQVVELLLLLGILGTLQT